MIALASLYFKVWNDGLGPHADRISMHWEAPTAPPSTTDRYERARAVDGGLRADTFYFSRIELESLVSGATNIATDCSTKLEVWGDMWTFIDFEIPTRAAGSIQVEYRRLHIPRFFMRVILRKARQIWAAQRAVPESDRWRCERVEIEISAAQRARFARLYGQGTGDVALNVDERAVDAVAADLESSPAFVERIEHLQRIARNSTAAFFERASLSVYKDGDSYGWTARTPRGKTILWGGLIRRDAGDWSVHT